MMIRKKIIVSNLLMICVPVIFLLMLAFIWLNTAGKRYWTPIEEMYEDQNGVISAQNLIYAYQDELWDTNWEELESVDEKQGSLKKSPDMIRIQRELTDIGYHFMVILNENNLYSNLSQSEKQQMEQLIGPIPEQAKTVTVGNDQISVIRCTFFEGEEECSIIAVNDGKNHVLSSKSYLQNHVIPYIWLFFTILAAMIIVVNFCCSRWITTLILPPLQEIKKGMKKIRDGEFRGDIPMIRKDELGEVCNEFNEMKRYLKKSKEERMKYEIYRKELISGISHDLRTPLTTIKGYVGGILDGIANTEEKRDKYLLAVKTRAEDMENLVNQLSAYNKMENQVFQYQMEKTELRQYLSSYVEENKGFDEEHHLHISLQAEGEFYLHIDRKEFKRVIDNIMMNSIRYRQKDSSAIQIRVRKEKAYICLEIGDDGPGVPQKDLERIFESFCRLDESRTHFQEGSGLGLAIVKRIVNDHKGTVTAKNNSGLEICMRFPVMEERMD